jgi:hypothetical protein
VPIESLWIETLVTLACGAWIGLALSAAATLIARR